MVGYGQVRFPDRRCETPQPHLRRCATLQSIQGLDRHIALNRSTTKGRVSAGWRFSAASPFFAQHLVGDPGAGEQRKPEQAPGVKQRQRPDKRAPSRPPTGRVAVEAPGRLGD